MSYHDLTAYIQDGMLNEEEGAAPAADGATTMDAISYLPTQVGVVQSAMRKLKKKKNKWNLEIQESGDNITVQFEDQLKIEVPREHWESFQEMFEGTLDEDVCLDLQSKSKEPIYLDSKGILENRKDELKSKIQNLLDCPEIKAAERVVQRYLDNFPCEDNLFEDGRALIHLFPNCLMDYTKQVLENCKDDLGALEITIESLFQGFSPQDKLAGARYKSSYKGINLILEARVSFAKDCSFSIAVEDGKVADCLEEACNGLQRVGNVFYPRYRQLISSEGILEELKEVIDDVGDQNET